MSLLLVFDPARSAHGPARGSAGVLAVFQHLLAVHKHMNHAGCVLMRFDEGRVVLNLVRIEYDDVSVETLAQFTSSIDSHVLCWQSRQFSNGFLQRDDLLITNILSEHAGKAAVGTRVRIAFEEHALGSE